MSVFEGARFIPILGRDGAGKDTVGRLLLKRGVLHVSTSAMLKAETIRRGLDPTVKETLANVIEQLYDEQGPDAMITPAVECWHAQAKTYTGA